MIFTRTYGGVFRFFKGVFYFTGILLFSKGKNEIAEGFYTGEFLPLTNKKTISIASRFGLLKSCWLTFTETIKKIKKNQ